MPDVLKSSSLAMYADDCKCYKTIKIVSGQPASNELYFQRTKCHNLRISRKKTSLPRVYNLNNTELILVTKEKTVDLK